MQPLRDFRRRRLNYCCVSSSSCGYGYGYGYGAAVTHAVFRRDFWWCHGVTLLLFALRGKCPLALDLGRRQLVIQVVVGLITALGNLPKANLHHPGDCLDRHVRCGHDALDRLLRDETVSQVGVAPAKAVQQQGLAQRPALERLRVGAELVVEPDPGH